MRRFYYRFPVRVPAKERILLTKRLALYLHSGISLLDALHIVRDDSLSRGHVRILTETIQSVQQGSPLSHALRLFPHAYPPYVIQILAVGEATGSLSQSLTRVSEMLARRNDLLQSLRRAFAYPILIGLGTCAISFFLVAFVLPAITPLFRGLGTELPISTRILLWITKILPEYGLLLLCGVVLSALGGTRAVRHQAVRERIDYLVLCIPGIGKVVRAYSITVIFKLLETLLRSGVRLDIALDFVVRATRNTTYRNSLSACGQVVSGGRPVSEGLLLFPALYPRTVIQIISTGERTGSLSSSAESIAELFEEEMKDRLASLSSLLEPILLLCMGLVVGFIALATISPMYSLTQNISAY